MKMNKKLMIAIPVVAGVLVISGGAGVALAKGVDQQASNQNISDYTTTPATTNPGDSTPVVYCGGFGGMMGGGVGQGLVSQQVATLLGTTVNDLQSQLNSGKTLADIAGAKGVSQDQLIQTMMAPFNDQMGLMLKYGYLTQDQINSMTLQMQKRLQTVITSEFTSADEDGWGFMGGMMQGYSGGMMGGWVNPQTQPGAAITPQQPGATAAPRTGFGGMMGGAAGPGGMMGRW